MKTMLYEGRLFWKMTEYSAVRPHKVNRLEILNILKDGSITWKSRNCSPYHYQVAKETLEEVSQ